MPSNVSLRRQLIVDIGGKLQPGYSLLNDLADQDTLRARFTESPVSVLKEYGIVDPSAQPEAEINTLFFSVVTDHDLRRLHAAYQGKRYFRLL